MLKFNVKRVGELLDNEGLWLNQCGNLFSVPGFGEIIDVRYDCPEEELGCIITFADGFEMDFDEQFIQLNQKEKEGSIPSFFYVISFKLYDLFIIFFHE